MTELEYFSDTYKFDSEAVVLKVTPPSGDDNLAVVELDKTIFYPQGGGQPSDVGSIICAQTGVKFNVKKVTMNPTTKVVEHYGNFEETGNNTPTFKPSDVVRLSIDPNLRILHARLHSAGHLLDAAVKRANLGDFIPGKGCHFPKGAYVEYEGTVYSEDKKASAKEEIQKWVDTLVQEQSPVQVQMTSYDGVEALCGSIPPYITDKTKEYRIVSMAGVGCPCGGTHVRNTSEIGRVVVQGVKFPKGKMRVSYTVN